MSKIMLTIVFLLGVVSAYLIPQLAVATFEIPLVAPERLSPSDYVKEDQIKVYDNRVVINVKGVKWSSFADTNSMDPIIDKGANALQIVPKNADDIEVGDIVSYKHQSSKTLIIHRVIVKDQDEKGVYFILKGDNNKVADPGKVRFDQIKKVLIGVIY